MVIISDVHRKMAEIMHMATDKHGNMWIGEAEIRMLVPLLKRNLLLVQRIDELKELGYQAAIAKDDDWHREIVDRLNQAEHELDQWAAQRWG